MPSLSSAPSKPRSGRSAARQASRNRSLKSSRLVVLGLDLSLTGCGLAVWDGQRLLRSRRLVTHPVNSGKVQGQLDPRRFRGTDEARIEWLRRHVVRNIRKFQPDLVIIEGHAFGARGRGLTILHELHGVIKNELHRRGIPFSAESPTTIKLLFAGKGGASKDEMIAAAKTLCDKDLSDDEADALGCAWYGHANYKNVLRKVSGAA